MPSNNTLFDTIWDDHRVTCGPAPGGGPDTLYIDLHLVHEVTSPQAFDILRERGLPLHRPGQTLATMDHSTPTTPPTPHSTPQWRSGCTFRLPRRPRTTAS